MPTYTVQCIFATYFHTIVAIDAATPEEACDKAVTQANDQPNAWRALDTPGHTFVERIAIGLHDDPWNAPAEQNLLVPKKYSEAHAIGAAEA